MPETWRSIIGFEGIYEVSSLGRVKRVHGGMGATSGRNLKGQRTNKFGYLKVSLYKNDVAKQCLIARLVASAFIPNPFKKPQVNHKNGVVTDNTVENLEWATDSENKFHRARILKVLIGQNHKMAKLKNVDISQIRQLLKMGISQVKIGKKYGVSGSTVWRICHNINWAHVK